VFACSDRLAAVLTVPARVARVKHIPE